MEKKRGTEGTTTNVWCVAHKKAYISYKFRVQIKIGLEDIYCRRHVFCADIAYTIPIEPELHFF